MTSLGSVGGKEPVTRQKTICQGDFVRPFAADPAFSVNREKHCFSDLDGGLFVGNQAVRLRPWVFNLSIRRENRQKHCQKSCSHTSNEIKLSHGSDRRKWRQVESH